MGLYGLSALLKSSTRKGSAFVKSFRAAIVVLVTLLFTMLPATILAAPTQSSSSKSLQQQIKVLLDEIDAMQSEISASSVVSRNIVILHENSNEMMYGFEDMYSGTHGVNHVNTYLSSFTLSNDPHAPFGVTYLDISATAELLSKLNVETAVSTSTADPNNWALNAAYGSHWFEWQVKNNFVTTNQGKVNTAGNQTVALGGDPGYAMTVFFPLREVITLLGGTIAYNSSDQGMVIEFSPQITTAPPFYVP